MYRGVARIFQRGGGRTVSKPFNYGQDIVMAFSPPVVGCLVKKRLVKGGGGHGQPRTPLATPLNVVLTIEIPPENICYNLPANVIIVNQFI